MYLPDGSALVAWLEPSTESAGRLSTTSVQFVRGAGAVAAFAAGAAVTNSPVVAAAATKVGRAQFTHPFQ
jgi:hypothetical protein